MVQLRMGQPINQLSRSDKYKQAKAELISKDRLYPCYETPEGRDVKNELQLSSGKMELLLS